MNAQEILEKRCLEIYSEAKEFFGSFRWNPDCGYKILIRHLSIRLHFCLSDLTPAAMKSSGVMKKVDAVRTFIGRLDVEYVTKDCHFLGKCALCSRPRLISREIV